MMLFHEAFRVEQNITFIFNTVQFALFLILCHLKSFARSILIVSFDWTFDNLKTLSFKKFLVRILSYGSNDYGNRITYSLVLFKWNACPIIKGPFVLCFFFGSTILSRAKDLQLNIIISCSNNSSILGQLYEYGQGVKPKILSTPEASPKYDDSYMGYSVTVGDFAGQGIQGVGVGVPRGSDLRGLVSLLS